VGNGVSGAGTFPSAALTLGMSGENDGHGSFTRNLSRGGFYLRLLDAVRMADCRVLAMEVAFSAQRVIMVRVREGRSLQLA